jgi:hypothetical protein
VAFGVLAFELLIGKLLFDGVAMQQLIVESRMRVPPVTNIHPFFVWTQKHKAWAKQCVPDVVPEEQEFEDDHENDLKEMEWNRTP